MKFYDFKNFISSKIAFLIKKKSTFTKKNVSFKENLISVSHFPEVKTRNFIYSCGNLQQLEGYNYVRLVQLVSPVG